MQVVILVLVVIAALLAIISGVWVALALITAISADRDMPGLRRDFEKHSSGRSPPQPGSRGTQSSRKQCRTDKQSSDKDI